MIRWCSQMSKMGLDVYHVTTKPDQSVQNEHRHDHLTVHSVKLIRDRPAQARVDFVICPNLSLLTDVPDAFDSVSSASCRTCVDNDADSKCDWRR